MNLRPLWREPSQGEGHSEQEHMSKWVFARPGMTVRKGVDGDRPMGLSPNCPGPCGPVDNFYW
jgi:hypothetical protein